MYDDAARSKVDEWKKTVNYELRTIDRATISMWNCAMHNRMPPSHSINNYGIENMAQIKTIKWCIDNRMITPLQLDNAKQNGKKISDLLDHKDNPNGRVIFTTMWDLADTMSAENT